MYLATSAPLHLVSAGNCDLVSCKLVLNEKTTQHFLVFKDTEFILVDPHKSKLGAGIVHFIAFLQVQYSCKVVAFSYICTYVCTVEPLLVDSP